MQKLVHRYTSRITTERRPSAPDDQRLEELKAGRPAELAGQAQLAIADLEAAGWIAAVYTARLKELNQPGA